MGASTQTSTSSSTSGPTNPDVQATTSKLAKGINTAYDAGLKVNPVSLYGGVGDTTKQSWQTALNAANNPAYASGINGAIDSYGRTASGANLGQNDPGYATLRSKLQNDVLTGTNSSFNNSGLFGSDNNQYAANKGLGDALGALDYQQYSNSLDRQTQAAQMLPQLFAAGQQPAAVSGSVGAAKDADTQAALLGQNDLFRRTNDAPLDLLSRLTSTAAGNAATSGTSTTSSNTTPATPWWQGALGLAGSLL